MSPTLASLLLVLGLIVLLARLAGMLSRRVGQPPVIGEIAAGLLLGPTLLGVSGSTWLFPPEIRSSLSTLAGLGVALFMLLLGVQLEGLPRRGARAAVSVALGSVLLPLALGVALGGYVLLDRHTTSDRAGLVLFVGIALAVTAFPVLARILEDRGLSRTKIGTLALAAAAIGDVLAWVLLAGVAALVGAAGATPARLLLALPYLALMVFVVRPLMGRLLADRATGGRLGLVPMSVILAGALVSAGFTEWIGLHLIFGAFLFGAVLPRQGTEVLRQDLMVRVGEVNSVLLLPVFFVVAGLSVDLSALGFDGAFDLVLILAVAVVGKLGGVLAGGRLAGLSGRESLTLATLMNTRGLTELIILGVGRQLGVLDLSLYSSLVVMALVTTAMTGPLLHLLGVHGADPASAADPASGPELASGPEQAPGPDSRAVPSKPDRHP